MCEILVKNIYPIFSIFEMFQNLNLLPIKKEVVERTLDDSGSHINQHLQRVHNG